MGASSRVLLGRSRPFRLTSPLSRLLLGLVRLLSRALLDRSGLLRFLGRVLLGGSRLLGLVCSLRQVLLDGVCRLCGVLRSTCRPFGALRLLR
jgi:hypothetical protein